MFANGQGDRGSIPSQVIPKTQKMVLDAALLNTQHYKVRIKGKVEQFREMRSTHLHLGVVVIEKKAFGSPSTKVANFTYLYIIIIWRCPWCNGNRRRKWTRRHEFKDKTDCISHSTNILGKGMNPIILPPAMVKL